MKRLIRHISGLAAGFAAIMAVTGCDRIFTPGPAEAMFEADVFHVYADSIVTDTFKAVADGPMSIVFEGKTGMSDWHGDSVIRRYPLYASEQAIVDALYNRGMTAIRTNAGRKGDAIGLFPPSSRYAAEMAMAIAAPEKAMIMLRSEVREGRLRQPGGAGGSWPVVADRAMWAVAAFEVYKMTGDRHWLREAYDIMDRTLRDDRVALFDQNYGLMHGIPLPLDSNSLFPSWMDGADLYSTMCLTTNATYAGAYRAMGEMAVELGLDPGEYTTLKRNLNNAINERLWIPNLGYFSQYLYCSPYPIQSQASDNLGQALCVVFGVTSGESAASLIAKTPRYVHGVPRVYPQMADTSGMPPTRLNAVPEVLAYWNRAAAATGNARALDSGISSQLLSALTVDSVMTLRSAVSLASTVYRVVMGLDPKPDRLAFSPTVPAGMPGKKWLSGVRYRKATLDITVSGTGNKIANFTIDGVTSHSYSVDSSLVGHHKIDITLASNKMSGTNVNIVEPARMPATPKTVWSDPRNALISGHKAGLGYMVYLNDDFREIITSGSYQLYEARNYTTVAFVPVFDNRLIGYTPRPYSYMPRGTVFRIEAPRLTASGTDLVKDKQFGAQVVELTTEKNTHITFDVNVSQGGDYFVDIRYANGAGPRLSGTRCAVRTLSVNGVRAGVLVMPQRGAGKWTETGFTNPVTVRFNGGRNTISIDYIEPYNVNVNGEENTALIEYVRFIRR